MLAYAFRIFCGSVRSVVQVGNWVFGFCGSFTCLLTTLYINRRRQRVFLHWFSELWERQYQIITVRHQQPLVGHWFMNISITFPEHFSSAIREVEICVQRKHKLADSYWELGNAFWWVRGNRFNSSNWILSEDPVSLQNFLLVHSRIH